MKEHINLNKLCQPTKQTKFKINGMNQQKVKQCRKLIKKQQRWDFMRIILHFSKVLTIMNVLTSNGYNWFKNQLSNGYNWFKNHLSNL